MTEKPLYKTSGGVIYPANIATGLTKLGLQQGDVVFVHSDISAFGKMASFDAEYLLGSLIRCFMNAVGASGAVIMPTFTYSFCKGEVYDPAESKSTVGILTEFFRNHPDVKRSKHPIFSVAVTGRHQEYLLDTGKDSFGENSIFDKLRKVNGKIIIFGSSFITSCTYLHYVEQSFGVPYRYLKTFTGEIRDNGKVYEDYATFYVRYLDRIVKLDTNRFEQYLLETGLMQAVSLGEGHIQAVSAQDFFLAGQSLLQKDPYFFLSADSTR